MHDDEGPAADAGPSSSCAVTRARMGTREDGDGDGWRLTGGETESGQ